MADPIDEWPTPIEDPNGIIWLASYPKSGNTWVRAFLHNLFDVQAGVAEREHDINALTEFSVWEVSAQRFTEILGKSPVEAGPDAVAAIRCQVQQEIADRGPGLHLVKTHNALVVNRGYPTVHARATAGIVYVVRNPLDVAVSLAGQLGEDIEVAIRHMAKSGLEIPGSEKSVHEAYCSWSENVESWTSRALRGAFLIRYEDMLARPAEVFGALSRHLLMRPTAEQLAEAVARSSFDRLRRQEAERGFKEKAATAERFFREGRADQWRDALTRDQVNRIVVDHSAQMRRFGYLTPDIAHLAPPPGAAMIA